MKNLIIILAVIFTANSAIAQKLGHSETGERITAETKLPIEEVKLIEVKKNL